MNPLPTTEKNARLLKLQQVLIAMQAEACLITSSVNQYWLTGFIFDGYILVYAEGEPLLFVRRPTSLSGENIVGIRKPEQIPSLLREAGLQVPKQVLLESDTVTLSAALRLQAALEMPEIKNISAAIRTLRSVKSEYELNQIRESAAIHTKVYELIPSLYRKGMTDLALQIEIERQMRLHGSAGIFRSFGENMDIFMGSMLAGDNAQVPSPYDYALGGGGITPLLPLGANGTPLTPGTTLMVDMAGNYRPNMDDMTRTFVIEHAPDIAYKAHQVSLDIVHTLEATTKAGVPCAELWHLAEKIVREDKLEAYFMGTAQQARFVGHGVGLEINEPPVLTLRSKEVLEPGMAIAIEPKFVLPGIGAVGVENTYVVHDDRLEKVTLYEESLVVLS
ncbi:MAG: Xaa-Pro peptidase family protein [Proteiniphilum sp.]